MKSYIRFILRHRLAVIAALLVLSGISLFFISQAVIASSVSGLFLGESPAYKRYLTRIENFGSDESIIIAIKDAGLHTAKGVGRLGNAVTALEQLPDVGRVVTLMHSVEVTTVDGVVDLKTFGQQAKQHPDQLPALLNSRCQDPLVGQLLLSQNCRHTALVIELSPDEGRNVDAYPPFVAAIDGALTDAGYARDRRHHVGLIAVLAEIMEQTRFNLERLFPLVCLVLLVAVWLMFHRLWPVFITGLVALIGVICTLGFGVLLFHQVDIFMALCPIFILIISFSDVVHLCSSYLLELQQGKPKQQAIEQAASEVGLACLFTSLTTFAGFVSMTLIPVPVFRQSGVIMGFGVAISLLFAMTLTPILFSLMPTPRPPDPQKASAVQRTLLQTTQLLNRLTQRYPWPIIAAFALLLVGSFVGATAIQIETDFTRRFASDNRVQKDQRFFSQHFAGSASLEIFISGKQPKELLDPDLFAQIADLEKALVDLPQVDRSLSLVGAITMLHRGFNEGTTPAVPPLPQTRAALSQYLLLLDMADPSGLKVMVDAERQTMRLHLRLSQQGFMAAFQAGQQVQELAKQMLRPGVQVEVSGLVYLMGSWLDDLVAGQQRALLTAFVTILLMMVIALRSFGAGLWSMIPNTLPLVVVLGYVGFFWDRVDSDTYLVALLAIGIGVDNTIHFLIRYKLALAKVGDRAKALQQSFAYSGRAIVITSFILVAGFLPFAISDYFTTHMMGTLLPGCLLVALLANLVLLPAMIKVGLFK